MPSSHSPEELLQRIRSRDFNLTVVGIGRVGLPLALSFAAQGVNVTGVDRDPDHVAKVNSGTLPFIEHGAAPLLEHGLRSGKFFATSDSTGAIAKADVVILTVGTPLNPGLRADTSQLDAALIEVGSSIRPSTLVITRSTISPGTTERLVIPALERHSGLTVGESLFVAYCPERIAEGKAVEELQRLPEIVGGVDAISSDLAEAVFLLLSADKTVHRCDPMSAELAKLFTNVYRYVNFALANEYALIGEHYKRDSREIIRILRDGYDRAPVPMPGPAGGPCLSKDGYFLIEELAFPDFVLMAWKLNDSVPGHLVKRLSDAIDPFGSDLHGKKVAVLGQAFKANIDDDRLSPSLRVIEMLQRLGADVVVHDPYLAPVDLTEALTDADGVIVATNHREYESLDLTRISQVVSEDCVIVDAWGIIDVDKASVEGLRVLTFGRG